MNQITLRLPEEALSGAQGKSPERWLTELALLDLYRRGLLSLGRVAELLGLPREDMIELAAEHGIDYHRESLDEVLADMQRARPDNDQIVA